MNEAERKAQIRRYWEQTGADQDASHEIYHDAAVLEFPQSGERFEGVANSKSGEASIRRGWRWRCETSEVRGTCGWSRERSATTAALGSPR